MLHFDRITHCILAHWWGKARLEAMEAFRVGDGGRTDGAKVRFW